MGLGLRDKAVCHASQEAHTYQTSLCHTLLQLPTLPSPTLTPAHSHPRQGAQTEPSVASQPQWRAQATISKHLSKASTLKEIERTIEKEFTEAKCKT